MHALLTSPELLELHQLNQAEQERKRLANLLKSHIPTLVKQLDQQALLLPAGREALGAWAKAGAILGYYPASNVPTEAETIQRLVSDHEAVHSRMAILQRQLYNEWVCEQIKKAWLDFNDPDAKSTPARMETCKHFLGPIDASHLDPIIM